MQPANHCKRATCSNTGHCVIANKPEGASCNDGFACTTGDVCDGAGHCSGTPDDGLCTSNNPCLSNGRCKPDSPDSNRHGCLFEAVTGGQTLTCGVGACARSIQQCHNGVEQPCVPGKPSPEICNGIDDDCDGVVDNGCLPTCDCSNLNFCSRHGTCTMLCVCDCEEGWTDVDCSKQVTPTCSSYTTRATCQAQAANGCVYCGTTLGGQSTVCTKAADCLSPRVSCAGPP